MKRAMIAAAVCCFSAAGAWAGPIDAACNSSAKAASSGLCSCIQQVADMTLTRSDQRLAAKFFRDPAQAQEVRVSRKRKHQEFWERYTNFGSTAEQVCAG